MEPMYTQTKEDNPVSAIRERILRNTAKNRIVDKIFSFLVALFSIVMLIPLVAILVFIAYKGLSHIHIGLFIHDERNGGILNAIIGSLMMVLMASVIAVPISVLTGLYLSENKNSRAADVVRNIVDVLQGIPSIILGIVAYLWLVVPFKSFSAFSGSFALSIMMMPIIIKNTEESLIRVPDSLREAGYALGIPRYLVMLQVVIPAGISGITTGVLLSVSRILGETAPLLFTAFGSRDLSFNLAKPAEALPPLIYKYATSPVNEWIDTAWAASFLLVLAVLALNIITGILTKKWKINY